MEVRTGFAAAGNARLYFRDIGQGPSIVVLHGGPDFDFDHLLPERMGTFKCFGSTYATNDCCHGCGRITPQSGC